MLAVPPLGAHLIMLPGDGTRDALLAENPVDDETLDRFMHQRRRALGWQSSNAAYDDLAMAALRRATLDPAIEAQKEALALSPADPYGWGRLAYLFMLTEGPSDEAARALTHSIETGPYEPHLMASRASSALLLEDQLDPEMKAHIPSLLRAAWQADPQALVWAAEEGRYTESVETALAEQPEELDKFRRLAVQ